ncbi:MAG TPA: adenylyltransferase/cytidyltransferase family protein [Candidatus Thermoplasmatota archaeon]|nr:adenylyltransferase/cytidyltransferase family protein [Candidatus Thermoplasmatota archaeon]
MAEARKRRVMAVGVFDLVHLGHVHYLQEARAMGDELVVVVATDEMVRKRKHVPIFPQEMRVEMVAALKPVDLAIVGDPRDQLASVERLRPDVIALGYDDYHKVEELRKALASRGLHPEIRRVTKFDHDLDGTRKIIRRIFDSGLFTPSTEKALEKPFDPGAPPAGGVRP